MGILHAGILNALSDCKVVAICETEMPVRKIARKALPKMRFYESPFDMAAEENLNAVYVTTPISRHASVVTDLAAVGKPFGIFIEKPLARNTAEAHEVLNVASGFATVAMIGFQKRFLPQFIRAKGMLDGGAIGSITAFKGYSYFSSVFAPGNGWRFRKGEGGVLLDLGSHLLDLVIWYFGFPASVTAHEASIYSEEVEDSAQVDFEFKSGVHGEIDVSWSKEGYRLPETGIEVYGSNGMIKVNDYTLETVAREAIPGLIKRGRTALLRAALVGGVNFLLGDPEYCIEDVHFIDCLRTGRAVSPNFEDGLKVNQVIDLAHESARKK